MCSLRSYLLALCLLWSPALAQDGYVPVWVESPGSLSDQAVTQAVDKVVTESPDRIVVLVHVFATGREVSAEQYTVLSARIKKAFQEVGKRVTVVGFQWDSAVSRFLFSLPGAYHRKTLEARAIGRGDFRRFMLALQARMPAKPLNIFAHSMGCELSGAGLVPEVRLGEETEVADSYQSQEQLEIHGFVMCGSDLDYDVGYEGGGCGEKTLCGQLAHPFPGSRQSSR